MKEYLVLMFDDNKDLCSSFRTTGISFHGVRYSNMMYDMIGWTKSTIESLIIVCLDNGSYRSFEV